MSDDLDPVALKARLDELESTNKRLLGESVSNKAKAQELKAELEKREQEELEKSGDIKAQLEREKTRAKTLEEETKRSKNLILDDRIKATIGKYAKDAHSLDAVLNQKEFSDLLKSGIDRENLTYSDEVAKDYVNKVFEKNPWLKKTPDMNKVDTTRPNGKHVGKEDLSKLSAAEIKAKMKNLKT